MRSRSQRNPWPLTWLYMTGTSCSSPSTKRTLPPAQGGRRVRMGCMGRMEGTGGMGAAWGHTIRQLTST